MIITVRTMAMAGIMIMDGAIRATVQTTITVTAAGIVKNVVASHDPAVGRTCALYESVRSAVFRAERFRARLLPCRSAKSPAFSLFRTSTGERKALQSSLLIVRTNRPTTRQPKCPGARFVADRAIC